MAAEGISQASFIDKLLMARAVAYAVALEEHDSLLCMLIEAGEDSRILERVERYATITFDRAVVYRNDPRRMIQEAKRGEVYLNLIERIKEIQIYMNSTGMISVSRTPAQLIELWHSAKEAEDKRRQGK
jgi:hypothetical protein